MIKERVDSFCTDEVGDKFGVIGRWYNRYARVITVFMLVCILSVSGVLIAKLSTDYGGNNVGLQAKQIIKNNVRLENLNDFKNILGETFDLENFTREQKDYIYTQDFYDFVLETADWVEANIYDINTDLIKSYLSNSRFSYLYKLDNLYFEDNSINSPLERLGGGEWYLDNTTLWTAIRAVGVGLGALASYGLSAIVGLLQPYVVALIAIIMAVPGLQIIAAYFAIQAGMFVVSLAEALLYSRGIAIKYKLWIIPYYIYSR